MKVETTTYGGLTNELWAKVIPFEIVYYVLVARYKHNPL